MVMIMLTRGRLAIGNVVTSMERPIEIHIYVYMT